MDQKTLLAKIKKIELMAALLLDEARGIRLELERDVPTKIKTRSYDLADRRRAQFKPV